MNAYTFTKENWPDYATGENKELFLSNDCGSYSSFSLIGSLKKAEHGLFVIQTTPGQKMISVLDSMTEIVKIADQSYSFESSRRIANGKIKKNDSFEYLTDVVYDGTVKMHYECGSCVSKKAVPMDDSSAMSMLAEGGKLSDEPSSLPEFEMTKHIGLAPESNSLAIGYDFINNSDNEAQILLTPWFNYRENDSVSYKNLHKFDMLRTGNTISLVPRENQFLRIDLSINEGKFMRRDKNELRGTKLTAEKNPEKNTSSHYTPYDISTVIPAHSRCSYSVIFTVVTSKLIQGWALLQGASDSHLKSRSAHKTIMDARQYLDAAIRNINLNDDDAIRMLLAANHFIYHPNTELAGQLPILFTSFPSCKMDVRKILIGLPGLTFYTGHRAEALEILYKLSSCVKDGLLPDYYYPEKKDILDDYYRHADLSLLYFIDVYKLLKNLKEDSSVNSSEIREILTFIYKGIFPTLIDIIDSYENNEKYPICLLENGFIKTGDENLEMTWMDEKFNDEYLTPRAGCAIEINALWYNALKIMEYLCRIYKVDGSEYAAKAEKLRFNFYKAFWNSGKNCLYDYLIYDSESNSISYPDTAVRPNQLYAISLPFELLMTKDERSVLQCLERKLLLKTGLKTLPSDHQNYTIDCIPSDDNVSENNTGIKHLGLAYTHFLGAYMSAYKKINAASKDGKEKLLSLYPPLWKCLENATMVGNLSEATIDDTSYIPSGESMDFAAVGEILRSYFEDQM